MTSPYNHHRTVDRVIGALEFVAKTRGGVTLKEASEELDAPKSSIQQLMSGLLATGYLKMRDRKYFLGPGAYLLGVMSSQQTSYASIDHQLLVELHDKLGHSVYVGALFGDNCIAVDQVGLGSTVDFAAWEYARRPLLTTAAGKIILANIPSEELHAFLSQNARTGSVEIKTFLEELPEIRETRLAYNHQATCLDVVAAATPHYDSDGKFVAAVVVVGPPKVERELEKLGENLRTAVASW